ncbi:MAG: hypothetical protein ACJAYY_000111 [Paraglaciecola sp.]|jgi:hypothetical protein
MENWHTIRKEVNQELKNLKTYAVKKLEVMTTDWIGN